MGRPRESDSKVLRLMLAPRCLRDSLAHRTGGLTGKKTRAKRQIFLSGASRSRRYAALTRFALISRRSFGMKKYPTKTGLMKNILRSEYQELLKTGSLYNAIQGI